ncbi:hypothetical protein FC093_15825 [Ilyomonas limi]|uniref:Uncharacterized protein n=1 Tax=Ilyomonas limi TaxID=2575867 RepID=A0A4U3L0K4_9BACT|nr:hypothetical protein [Ilyomonas limi]TKK66967.1 hypothetical protein FC093_15825 [Ilyomonas limi]
MTVNPSNVQHIVQPDFSQAYNSIHLIADLQSELAMLKAKVATYYHEEIVLRGDQIMMREYCRYFGIKP